MNKSNFSWSSIAAGMAIFAVLATSSCKKDEATNTIQPELLTENSSKDGANTLASIGEVIRLADGNWRASVNGVTRYTGTDYIASINAAIGGLTAGRTTKEWVTIKNSGSSGPSGGSLKFVNLQSYTGLDFSNTTFNCNSGDALIVPVQSDRKTQIEVKNLKVTGNPRYGIWFKGCTDMIVSNITMTLTADAGLGTRVDHSTAATRNLTINGTQTYSGGDMHIETYGLDGFNIGNVTTSNNRGCGVLLNQSKNGSVGTVTGNYNSNGGGYATFRVANNNGPNVTCAKVYSRNSGRGFFSVTGSNGTTVTTVDIANATSHGIFLEDASNTKVNGGTVSGSNPNVQHVRTSTCITKVNGQTYTAANGIW
jgi:hypothetical protein